MIKHFLLLLLTVSLVFAHGDHDHDHSHHDHDHHEDKPSATKVVALDDTTFDTHIAANEVTLVEFYAPWCGHCKALVPEYDAASLTLDGIASLAKVDCTLHRDLCGKYDVQGFPTLKMFRNDGSEPTDYDQARKADAIHKYIVKQKSPAYTKVDNDKDFEKMKDSEFSMIAFVDTADKNSLDQFVTLAKAYRSDFDFGLVSDSSVAKGVVPSFPGAVILRKFDEPVVTFSGKEFSAEGLEEFLVENALPLLGVIGPENYQKYVERGYPLLWTFVDLEKDKGVLDVVREVAKDFKKSVSFVYLDGVRWADHAKTFGLNGATPGLVIEDRQSRKNYVFPQSETVTANGLKTFVTSFSEGSLSATIKSEPIPEKNDAPVKIIVANNWEQIVMDPTKDVMVEVYAPWCGHCKTLAPKYEKLALDFQDTPSIVIGKIDGTENDVAYEVKGFPTILFYTANDKSNPIPYDGERNEAAMAKFIRATASTLKTDQQGTQVDGTEKTPTEKDEL